MAVLHRNEQFDPQSDSLVRKEMSRLRAKLADYYAGEGARDVVLIHSNRSYRFEFRWRSAAAEVPADPRPCLLILPPAPAGGAEALFDELMLCLGGSSRFRLISRTSAHWYAGLSIDVRQICGQSGADLLVEIALRCQDGAHSVLLWIVDGHNGNSLASTRVAVPAGPPGADGDWQQAAAVAAKWLNEYERSEEKR
jgi:hypothetical protein